MDHPAGATTSVAELTARARAAQLAWAERPLEARAEALAGVRARLLARADALAEIVHRETGKPTAEALLGEVIPSADVVAYWTDALEDALAEEELPVDALAHPGKELVLRRVPRGVVAAIMPWNFPLALPLRTIVPALLAGNAVVFKPSEVTAEVGRALAALFEGLLPEGLLGLVEGGAEAGAAVCAADVDLVVFTGSPRAGRAVAAACAERLVPCELELGGNDAALVLADADVARTAKGLVWGAFLNAGQNCGAVERVYVESGAYDALKDALVREVRALRAGDDVGPLTTSAQRAIVARHVDEALAAGARALVGGPADASPDDPRAYPPTLLELDAAHDALALVRDETFGPVLPLRRVADVDEGVRLANASRYGLGASVWTRDLAEGRRVAQRLRAGVVSVNAHGFTGALPQAPWGGVGESGWGVTGSLHALHAVTRPALLVVDHAKKPELYWFPYTPALLDLGRALARVRGGVVSVFGRLGALVDLVRASLARAAGR